MSDQPLEDAPPLFSIIIPLEFHRGQWEQSWLGWTSQTVDRSLYEIILVVPPDFPARSALTELAGSNARIETCAERHDIGLCAFGARKAQGTYLFLTESHCWPEPDVLELCLRAFQDHPEWAGFSCRSIPVCHNRLSKAEAAMYEADIEFGMKVHPWRKVLDQCFVTRREAYEASGGLRAELGHFAEWVLAANYYARGYQLGYLEQARFHHYYVGSLGELETFTLDFVRGEIAYFSRGSPDAAHGLLEPPPEWTGRDNFDRVLSRGILRMVAAAARLLPTRKWSAMWRWLWPALFADGLVRFGSRLSAAATRGVLLAATLVGSQAAIARWLTRHIAALIRYQRLRSVGEARCRGALVSARSPGPGIVRHCGFHPIESWSGQQFRWSEPEAAVLIEFPHRGSTIKLHCPAIRRFEDLKVHFFLDGKPLRPEAVAARKDGFELQLEIPASRSAVLGWICPKFAARRDPRRLGLPVAAIELEPSAEIGEHDPAHRAGLVMARSSL